MRFRTTIEATGKNTTDIPVSEKIVAGPGQSKRPSVRVTINGHTYRSTVASMTGQFMISLSAENRTRTGAAAGDEVEVDIELDTELAR